MVAELKAFGNMDMNQANGELKRNLKAVQKQAEALFESMDLLLSRISFEAGETDKWIALRDSILQFRTLEVTPGTLINIKIDEDNMEQLEEVYGAKTDACKNLIINDLIRGGLNHHKKIYKPMTPLQPTPKHEATEAVIYDKSKEVE